MYLPQNYGLEKGWLPKQSHSGLDSEEINLIPNTYEARIFKITVFWHSSPCAFVGK
jgi:hypothetical protein